MEEKTKTVKITKNLPHPTFSEIKTSNFQEMFFAIFIKTFSIFFIIKKVKDFLC